MASPRDRSRSPRGEAHHVSSSFPLADFLFEKGLLDERSVEFLKKSPRKLAEDVLLSLGPEVRNPSAFVTRKLAPRGAPSLPGEISAAEFLAPQHLSGGVGKSGSGAQTPWSGGGGAGEVITVHCNGFPRPLAWRSQAEAVAELLCWGVLDEGSADFLSKAPEREAKDIVASLGPDVRNPSAFVTRKLKELRLDIAHRGGDFAAGMQQAPVEQILVHHNGTALPLAWVSKEQAAESLVSWGVLDEGSADFLLKAPEHEAKQIVSSLGPDVRNPSAFVTRKLKELLRDTAALADMVSSASMPVDIIPVHHNGAQLSLQWYSKEQALTDLVRSGVLDEGSADFLMKAPEPEAKDIVASLGPDVRNPSAFVTRKMKELRCGGGLQLEHHPTSQASSLQTTLVIHHNGIPMTLDWYSAEQAIGQLASRGVLDEDSAEFLGKVPAEVAKEIIAALGPEVRNPSAFVTRKVKAALHMDASGKPVDASASAMTAQAPGSQELHTVSVYHNGARVTLTWHSQVRALEELVLRGILDQRSADFLAKIPDRAARDIVASLGPDVRNPSAFVTKEARKWQT